MFFKWIKQHLRIKVFFGISENAVKTQIWIAISTYLLIAITKKRLHLDHHSLYESLQITMIIPILLLWALYKIALSVARPAARGIEANQAPI